MLRHALALFAGSILVAVGCGNSDTPGLAPESDTPASASADQAPPPAGAKPVNTGVATPEQNVGLQ